MPAEDRPPWNYTIAYHRLVLAAAPSPCGQALDVGCGSGLLLAKLAERCGAVVGVDPDAAALRAAAGRLTSYDNGTLLQADVLTADLPDGCFDLVTAVASLLHLPLQAGLVRLAALVRPGGRLIVVGLYRRSTVSDYLTSAAAFPGGELAGVATRSHPGRRSDRGSDDHPPRRSAPPAARSHPVPGFSGACSSATP